MLSLKDLIHTMESIAPSDLAEDWDNVGLHLGHPAQKLQRVLLALTATPEVVEEAIDGDYDLLLTHHPLIFSPLKTLREDQPMGAVLKQMMNADLAHFCAHTNLDSADGGVNDVLAEALGLIDLRPLVVSGQRKRYKLTVFVPLDAVTKVQAALFEAGAGRQGAYDSCSWQSSGLGSYRPLAGAEPAIGEVGTFHEEAEARLEVLVDEEDLDRVQRALLQVHPYEEVAYDLFEEVHGKEAYGIGRIGRLPEVKTLHELLTLWSELFASPLRYSGSPDRAIERVAVCGGSGQSYISTAAKQGADLFLTGDIRYHGYEEARAKKIALIDAGHYASEALVLFELARRLEAAHPSLSCDVSKTEKNLYDIFMND